VRSDTEYFACDIHTIRLIECSWAGGWCEVVSDANATASDAKRVEPEYFACDIYTK